MKFFKRLSLARIIPAILFFPLLAGCTELGPGTTFDVKTSIGRQQLDLFMLTFWLGLAVLIVVFAVFLFVIIKYRVSDDHDKSDIPAQTHGHTGLEISWTILPIILVIIMVVPTVRLTLLQEAESARTSENDIVVNVTGHQWWWKFEYPELGITTANELHIPEGKRATFNLKSADVLHSFWVPQMAGKKDLIPGQDNVLWFIPDEGSAQDEPYYGHCAELCLGAHAYMRFRVKVDTAEEFDAWVNDMQGASLQKVSADPLVQKGRQAYVQKGCAGCHTVQGQHVGNARYPDLTNYGQRSIVAGIETNTPENLATWIRDPQIFKPGNYMPTLWSGAEGEEEQIEAIVAYLHSLGVEDLSQASAQR